MLKPWGHSRRQNCRPSRVVRLRWMARLLLLSVWSSQILSSRTCSCTSLIIACASTRHCSLSRTRSSFRCMVLCWAFVWAFVLLTLFVVSNCLCVMLLWYCFTYFYDYLLCLSFTIDRRRRWQEQVVKSFFLIDCKVAASEPQTSLAIVVPFLLQFVLFTSNLPFFYYYVSSLCMFLLDSQLFFFHSNEILLISSEHLCFIQSARRATKHEMAQDLTI